MHRSETPVSTVWLDVSLLLQLNLSQPTGIPRTTIAILRAWWDSGCTNLRLCRLDPARGEFFAVEPQEVLARYNAPVEEKKAPAPAPPSRLKMLVRPAIWCVPAGLLALARF